MNKKNLPLILALALPLVMIVAIAISIYAPGAGKQPKHNFIYSSSENNYYGDIRYSVVNGKLLENPLPPEPVAPSYPKPSAGATHIYLYDVIKNQATEITLAQAQNYKLDPSNISPDNYKVERGNGGGDFIFGGGGDYNTWYIKGYNRAHKLNLKLTGIDYYSFQFLGWVLN